jgi:hypothetical protein
VHAAPVETGRIDLKSPLAEPFDDQIVFSVMSSVAACFTANAIFDWSGRKTPSRQKVPGVRR